MSQTKTYKNVTCPDCRETRSIRSDSIAVLCQQCACRRNSKPGEPRPNRIRGENRKCDLCGSQYWYRPSEGDRRFCSSQCGNTARKSVSKVEKVGARTKANNALRDGKLTKHPCEQCGNENSQMHHEDYSYALNVQWLCFSCHTRLHVGRGDLKAKVA